MPTITKPDSKPAPDFKAERDYLWEQLVQLEERLGSMPPAAIGREARPALKAILDGMNARPPRLP